MKLTVAGVRDVVMLTLGAGGLARELFLIGDAKPDMTRVWVSIALLLGPAALLAWWSGRMGTASPSDVLPRSSESSSPPPAS